MRKYFSFLSLTLTGILIFSFSKAPDGDYRDNYCGSYTCKCIFTHLNQGYTGLLYDTSIVSVTVQKNAIDSMIDIITPTHTISVKLQSGAVYYFSFSEGRFQGDSLYLRHKPSRGPQNWNYFGKK